MVDIHWCLLSWNGSLVNLTIYFAIYIIRQDKTRTEIHSQEWKIIVWIIEYCSIFCGSNQKRAASNLEAHAFMSAQGFRNHPMQSGRFQSVPMWSFSSIFTFLSTIQMIAATPLLYSHPCRYIFRTENIVQMTIVERLNTQISQMWFWNLMVTKWNKMI